MTRCFVEGDADKLDRLLDSAECASVVGMVRAARRLSRLWLSRRRLCIWPFHNVSS